MRWAHNQIFSMYATFIVEEEREKSSICPGQCYSIDAHYLRSSLFHQEGFEE